MPTASKAKKEAINAVIYARYSSHGQTEQSIEGQLRDCHTFAEREGYTVLGEYMLYWSLQYGEHIEVLSPKGLRERVGAAARAIAGKYGR
jgi:predicted DNA-binding transcriptional regulator YafY